MSKIRLEIETDTETNKAICKEGMNIYLSPEEMLHIINLFTF